MTKLSEFDSVIQVTEVKEHEDGSATYQFDMDHGSAGVMAGYGIRLMVYCATYGLDVEEAFKAVKAAGVPSGETEGTKLDRLADYDYLVWSLLEILSRGEESENGIFKADVSFYSTKDKSRKDLDTVISKLRKVMCDGESKEGDT